MIETEPVRQLMVGDVLFGAIFYTMFAAVMGFFGGFMVSVTREILFKVDTHFDEPFRFALIGAGIVVILAWIMLPVLSIRI